MTDYFTTFEQLCAATMPSSKHSFRTAWWRDGIAAHAVALIRQRIHSPSCADR